VESDFHPSSVQWIRWLIAMASEADFVLHAADPVFDSSAAYAQGADTQNWIGPLSWEDASVPVPPCVLADGAPWILVSLSSARQNGELRIAETAINVLANTNYRVIVTLSDPDSQYERLPMLKNGYIARYVAHSLVLRSAILVICHAGYGTVAKSMYHGVPMVLIPWARDQPGVAARASALGIARVVRRELLDVQSLDAAVDDVLGDDGYRRRAAQHAVRLQSCDTGASVCRRIAAAIACLGNRNDTSYPQTGLLF
jgi:UDP:flavonoid glycosyltransferase YjiC (YdhE family)